MDVRKMNKRYMQIKWDKPLVKQYAQHLHNSSSVHVDALTCVCVEINMSINRLVSIVSLEKNALKHFLLNTRGRLKK